jgi:hypothetical protein
MSQPTATTDRLLGRPLPQTIGVYDVERVLSANAGYADYEARHRTLGHRLLLRHERWPSPLSARGSGSLNPSMDRATELAALDGLRRARRLQAELHHPRLVPVIDFFELDDEWFSVFARIPGSQSLHDIVASIRRNQRPPCAIAEFVALSAGVTDGLAAIHRAGFVHRTLGTHNVVVDDQGYVRLADVGCATPVDADDQAARAFRWFMRPASAAPEQFAVDGTFSPATDIWALGVALFELRYGTHPFWSALTSSLDELRAAVVEGVPAFPAAGGDSAEPLLRPWLQRLLEPVPQRRYGDAMEAQRDLQTLAAELEGQRPAAHAFVAMPFAETFDPLWRAIRAACVACRVSATRVDQSHLRDNIWNEVCDTIKSCDFTIAVVSSDAAGGPNPNVMVEIGYARALQKPVLLLTNAPDALPFDLRTQRALVYSAASVGGGEFHAQLVSFVRGIVAKSVTRAPDIAS